MFCGLSVRDLSARKRKRKFRFGVVSDVHFAHRETYGNRHYESSITKLSTAIDRFNDEKLDFIVELGDLKDQGNPPERQQTLSFLDEIETVLQKFDGPVYHVLGNHDMDSISKQEFLQHTTNPGKTDGKNYYSFIRNQIKFIVLDGNYNEDGSDYDSGNFDWTKAFIPPQQKEWLQRELQNDHYPVIVFIHELLDSFSGINRNLCIGNAEEIVSLLEQSEKVIAVIQGHHHPGHYSFRNGIHYYTIKGLIEGPFPENNNFVVIEIDRQLNLDIKGFGNEGSRTLLHRPIERY